MTKPPIKLMGPSKNDKGTDPGKPSEDDVVTSAQPTADAPQPRTTISNVESWNDAELNATLKVLRAEVRRRESEREALRPQEGSKVRILRGRPKYVGKVGTAVIVRKSRCFVSVPDVKSPAYVLISDLELVER